MRLSAGISTPKSRGINLTLALFVTRVLADHADNVLPLHDLARFTKSLY
jgi:hypothetical protein